VNDPKKPAWEILPQDAKPGEVILSKRNELGILSNFAATLFEYRGKRYASVEGFWQMMLYPEGPDDPRAKSAAVTWPHTREQVAQMVAFEAKAAGDVGEKNMRKLGIDWVTFEGQRLEYRSKNWVTFEGKRAKAGSKPHGEHYRLIFEAMRAKLEQNPKVEEILLSTGDLILRPDHITDPNEPDEWRYFDMWMRIRWELRIKI